MTTVAQRGFVGVLASAKKYRGRLRRGIFHGSEFAALMTTVTKRLFNALATGTPIIGLARFNLDGIGTLLGNRWVCHVNISAAKHRP